MSDRDDTKVYAKVLSAVHDVSSKDDRWYGCGSRLLEVRCQNQVDTVGRFHSIGVLTKHSECYLGFILAFIGPFATTLVARHDVFDEQDASAIC